MGRTMLSLIVMKENKRMNIVLYLFQCYCYRVVMMITMILMMDDEDDFKTLI